MWLMLSSWNQSRRDWRDHRRVPLMLGPFFSARTSVVMFVQVLAPTDAMLAVMAAESMAPLCRWLAPYLAPRR